MTNLVSVNFAAGKAAPARPRPTVDLFQHQTMRPFARTLTADQQAQAATLIRDAWVGGWTLGTLQTQLAKLLDRPRKATAALARTGLSVAAHS